MYISRVLSFFRIEIYVIRNLAGRIIHDFPSLIQSFFVSLSYVNVVESICKKKFVMIEQ